MTSGEPFPGAVPVLAATLAGVVVVVLLLVAATVVARARRRRRADQEETLGAAPRRRLYGLVADDEPDPDDIEALVALDHRTWRVVEPTVVGLLAKLRGESRGLFVDILQRRGAVEDAVARTHARRPVERARAAELLGAVGGPDAMRELDRLLGDPDRDVRAVATRALGRIADPTAALPLVTRLGGRNTVQAPDHLVAHALMRVGTPATNPLRAATLDARPEVRATALQILGHIGAIPAVDDLVTALAHDPVTDVRVRAATALGAIGSPRAVPALTHATEEELRTRLRVAAVIALGEVGARSSIETLAGLTADPEHWVAHHAAAGLAQQGPAGVERLQALAVDGTAEARAHAREALARHGATVPPDPDPAAGHHRADSFPAVAS